MHISKESFWLLGERWFWRKYRLSLALSGALCLISVLLLVTS